ncbi:Uncharacterized protein MSYG_3073 [Malassezia sympodialis ATCC 42132]|uniref:Glucose-methanol-choline oxidoreductase N-terminal domain-containing protein n=1 Tax=Malassezia sympodialis (strain ATCC 42132) TaxID=1230383 RepID=A0A1M8A8B9_MALS4|nr:Uncharacterized protein MSYG_3073 [Malassezia sympodialis ATCC 42132]
MILPRITALPALILLTLFSSLTWADNLHFKRELHKRGISVKPNDLDGKTFDYVIVGGGQAGLVVASRLSENSQIKVAVIEAGTAGTAKNETDRIEVPAANLYKSGVRTPLDWRYSTVEQPYMNNRAASWPRGKVLGGSSAINGMYYIRPTTAEHHTWGQLIGDTKTWGWNSMLNAYKKLETYAHPVDSVAKADNIQWDDASHGGNGPIYVSYPGYTYPPVGDFINTSSTVAVPFTSNPDGGNNTGTFVATSNINPTNWTRSWSRSGYIDPNVARSNLVILTDHQATQILFDTSNSKNVKATGVKFKHDRNSREYTVNAGREVILSAGSINTPQLLQLSGIGDAKFLQSKKVNVAVDLPGVGYNLHDHLSSNVQWSPKNASEIPPQDITGNPEQDSFINSAVAYVPGPGIMKDQWNSYIDSVKNNQTNAVNAYDAPDPVKSGYNLTYSTVLNLLQKNVPAIEILFSLTFGNIQVQHAIQHAFSRGSILINTTDPFDYPLVDPRYLEQSSDMDMLRAALGVSRSIGATQPLNGHLDQESKPGSNVTQDADIDNYIRSIAGTEYHPCGTAAMLPQDKGGVVDNKLLVYGTSNLRVVDASVIPFAPSAHLMSVIYATAEIGSEIIQSAQNNQSGSSGQGQQPSAQSSQSSSQGGASNGDSSNDSGNGPKNHATTTSVSWISTILATIVTLSLLL